MINRTYIKDGETLPAFAPFTITRDGETYSMPGNWLSSATPADLDYWGITTVETPTVPPPLPAPEVPPPQPSAAEIALKAELDWINAEVYTATKMIDELDDLRSVRANDYRDYRAKLRQWANSPSFPNPAFRPVLLNATVVSPRQIRAALSEFGLRDAVETAVAGSNQEIKDWWEFATSIERNNAQVVAMAAGLGLTSGQVDSLFELAQTK